MRFFQSQDYARKNTAWLLFFFVLNAVIISIFNGLAVVGITQQTTAGLAVACASLALFIFVHWVKTASLASGDEVAIRLGAVAVGFPIQDSKEKRLCNIVEEMAIASGTPVPSVYIMDSVGINAFAAGKDPKHAVVCVTRGSMDKLNREEMQAVIGHEFSHILNNDMRLNVRITGAVSAFMIFMRAGDLLLDVGRSRRSIASRSRDSSQVAVLGLALYALGGLGFLLGRFMQSRISQQREFLADASAAQFTRNPEALARAFVKVGSFGSQLDVANRYEMSHIFLSDPIAGFWSNFFQTHPPLSERIKRLMPASLNIETFTTETLKNHSSIGSDDSSDHNVEKTVDPLARSQNLAPTTPPPLSLNLLNTAGSPDQNSYHKASQLISEIPASIEQQLRNPENAKIGLFAVITSINSNRAELQELAAAQFAERFSFLNEVLNYVDPHSERKALIFAIALGALKNSVKSERLELWQILHQAFISDQRFTLLEGFLLLQAKEQLIGQLKTNGATCKISSVIPQTWNLLVWTCTNGLASSPERNSRQHPAQIHTAVVNLIPNLPQLGVQEMTWFTFEDSIRKLQNLELKEKKVFLSAVLALSNQNRSAMDSETFRLLASSLNIPIPLI